MSEPKTWAILLKDGQPYPNDDYTEVVEVRTRGDRTEIVLWSGQIGQAGPLVAPWGVRAPKNAKERKRIADAAAARAYYEPTTALKRWANRAATTVEWGNLVGGFRGQSFRETFATEADAIERERQATAGESIGVDRAPIALTREDLATR